MTDSVLALQVLEQWRGTNSGSIALRHLYEMWGAFNGSHIHCNLSQNVEPGKDPYAGLLGTHSATKGLHHADIESSLCKESMVLLHVQCGCGI